MKITLCGSIAFIDEMHSVKSVLEELGHEIKLPPREQTGKDGKLADAKELYAIRQQTPATDHWIWDVKEIAMHSHFDKVEWSDAILVLNLPKKGIEHYVGANTLIEMGLAFHLKKPIYLLYPVPEMAYKEEILGMKPIVLNGNLHLLSLSPQAEGVIRG